MAWTRTQELNALESMNVTSAEMLYDTYAFPAGNCRSSFRSLL